MLGNSLQCCLQEHMQLNTSASYVTFLETQRPLQVTKEFGKCFSVSKICEHFSGNYLVDMYTHTVFQQQWKKFDLMASLQW